MGLQERVGGRSGGLWEEQGGPPGQQGCDAARNDEKELVVAQGDGLPKLPERGQEGPSSLQEPGCLWEPQEGPGP